MASDESEPSYFVVVNDEEQYSISAAGRQVPLGWKTVGEAGPKTQCLAYIEQVWIDQRPLSLRQKMQQSGA